MNRKLIITILAFNLALVSWSQVNTSISFSVNQIPCDLGVGDDLPGTWNVAVYPNPSDGMITVRVISGNEFLSPELTICNIIGECVLYINDKIQSVDYVRLVDLSALPQGIYFVRVSDISTSNSQVYKIVLTH